jgi:hypothetical protein
MKEREVMFSLVPNPHEKADEDDDFEQYEFYLGKAMAELAQRIGMAALGHTSLFSGQKRFVLSPN